jgi:DNA-directed RNA polymerase subunit RPC12/RpoP
MQTQAMQVLVDPSGQKIEVICSGCGQKVIFTMMNSGDSVFCRSCGIQIEFASDDVEILEQQI